MKWGSGWKINSWETLKQLLLVILIICVLASTLLGFDYLNWKDTINIVKQQLPTNGIGYTFVKGFGYVPFVWNGNIKGKITIDATKDGIITQPMKISYWFVKDGDSLFSNGWTDNGFIVTKERPEGNYNWSEIEGYIAYVELGDKIYKTTYQEQKIDYPITQEIVTQNTTNIFYSGETPKQIAEYTKFLLTFTHDSLNNYLSNMFNTNPMDYYKIPNIYAYRLNQIIYGQIQYKTVAVQEWTGQRKGKLLLLYSINGKEEIKWFYNPFWFGCIGGSGYQFVGN